MSLWRHDANPDGVVAARPRIDPRAALLAFMPAMVAVLVPTRPPWVGTMVVLAVAGAVLAGLGEQVLAGVRSLAFVVVLIAITSWIEGGAGGAALALVRLIAFIAVGTVLLTAAPPEDLAEALRLWHVPLRVAFVIGSSIRFLPLITQTFQDVREAQEARGIHFTPFWLHMRAYLALVVPVLREVFRVAEQLAQALESRGFSAEPRTPPSGYGLRLQDVALVMATCVVAIAAVLWGR